MDTATSTSTPVDFLHAAVGAYHSHAWAILAGIILTVLVLVVRQFNLIAKLPSKVVPWATVGLSMTSSIALGLSQGQPWDDIAVTGLAIGLIAVGAYETAVKAGQDGVAAIKAKFGPNDPPVPPASGQ